MRLPTLRCLLCFCLFLSFWPLEAAPRLRIGLFRRERPAHLIFSSTGDLTIFSSEGISLQLKNGEKGEVLLENGRLAWRINRSRSHRSKWLKLRSVSTLGRMLLGTGQTPIRPYRGEVEIRIRQGDLLVIERAELEDYVAAVLPSEMKPDWPMEAQAAQAVVARSFALGSRRRHITEGFDLCDTTHCQVYRGALWEGPAARKTAGWVLMRYGRPLRSLYSSTCGGMTADSRQVWSENTREPEISPVRDGLSASPYCRFSPHFRWSSRLSRSDLEESLRRNPKTDPQGKLKGISIERKDSGRRVLWVRIDGSVSRTVPAVDFWKAVGEHSGWDKVKSTWFELSRNGEVYTFRGRGLGHGVGLCQWGAREMARQGKDFRIILRHYFPHSRLHRVY